MPWAISGVGFSNFIAHLWFQLCAPLLEFLGVGLDICVFHKVMCSILVGVNACSNKEILIVSQWVFVWVQRVNFGNGAWALSRNFFCGRVGVRAVASLGIDNLDFNVSRTARLLRGYRSGEI